MGLFDKIKNVLGTKDAPKPAPAPKAKKEKKVQPVKSAKEIATEAGEPYVSILSFDIDPTNVHSGSFELDWNSIFITQLVKAGYMKKKEDTDQDIVDRWFNDVCRNVALELYAQVQADPENRDMTDMRTIINRDLGNGRTEVS